MTDAGGRGLLVIGTGPLMMLQALAEAKAGAHVTFVDRAPRFGGSWSTPPLLGLDRVECGVHLLENRPRLYASLAALGIDLVRDHDGFMLWKERRLPLGPSRALFHSFVALNALRRGNFDGFRRVGASALRSMINLAYPIAYPRGGCAEIIQALRQELEGRGALFRFGPTIHRLIIDTADGVVCETDDGPIKADRVLIGSRAHAPTLIDGSPQERFFERRTIHSLLVRGVEPNGSLASRAAGFSYVEVLADPMVKRLRDVRPFALPQLSDADLLLCIQLRPAGERRISAAGLEPLVERLRALHLLSADTSITDWAGCSYTLETLSNRALAKLERAARGRIRAIRTTDFADGFVTAAG